MDDHGNRGDLSDESVTEQVDWELFHRWATGRCDAAESEELERWIEARHERSHLALAVRRLVEEPGALAECFDVSAASARMAAMIQGPPEPPPSSMRVHRPTPLPSMHVVGRRRSFGRIAAAFVVAAAAVGALMWWAPRVRRTAAMRQPEPLREITAARGQLAQIRLADGTQIVLGAESRLRYPERFTDDARRVYLEGEGYFDVTPDARRPFIVQTRGGVAEELGTTFVVRQYAADSAMQVVVESGRVALRAATSAAGVDRVLEPGHLGVLTGSGEVTVRSVNPDAYLSWIRGRLVFDDTSLPDVLAQLARWHDVEFMLSDSSLASRHFNGTFDRESLTQILDALAPALHTRYERRGRMVVLFPLPE